MSRSRNGTPYGSEASSKGKTTEHTNVSEMEDRARIAFGNIEVDDSKREGKMKIINKQSVLLSDLTEEISF